MKRLRDYPFGLLAVAATLLLVLAYPVLSQQQPEAAVLALTQAVSAEPLLGGTISYQISVGNNGSDPVTDKGYNLTISDTLPAGLTFLSASIQPTFTSNQPDGSTRLLWDNISDLEVTEELVIEVTAGIDDALTLADSFTNSVSARLNTAPDNSGLWLEESSDLATGLQTIDIEVQAHQSTANEQATGAGEYDDNADWPYAYTVTVRNNDIDNTDDVEAVITLPPGIAYMGSPLLDGSPSTPGLTLLADGSLNLTWDLGTLTPAHFSDPVEITFATAIPYRYRTGGDS
ncbi:MAG: DUF11 domain-containing protein, partial [Anaerolineales bacterium]|nr:DUF11 domain-containing protein [Anaerolineales bacterium]